VFIVEAPGQGRSPEEKNMSEVEWLRHRLTPRAIPAILVGVPGVGGFLLLPGYLLYAGSAALAAGLIGLGLLLPVAGFARCP
jgi:hypothetical protein